MPNTSTVPRWKCPLTWTSCSSPTDFSTMRLCPFLLGSRGWLGCSRNGRGVEIAAPQSSQRAHIMESYQKMMKALLQYQGKDGVWHQLLDHPESYPETSCTGMFTFAMITGVKHGWLDKKTYGKTARKGWLGLVSYIQPNGDIRNVCQGTGKKNDLQY